MKLRLEFYNVPNHFVPSDPETRVGGGTTVHNTPYYGGNCDREVQYTARLHFKYGKGLSNQAMTRGKRSLSAAFFMVFWLRSRSPRAGCGIKIV